ncbi:MAG: beta-galactosidase, partial [Ardenticatenales bacterium]|nr:beta-galactosidase [Ardenticatenales bacterium]
MPHTPITYGVDYYPEQWPETRWAEDARLMREAGLHVVRLAEFAWALFETAEGTFEWAWLDRALAVLGEAGLKVVLCTPTPTPPAWLTETYPDCLNVDERGVRMSPGTRRHICANHADYRRLAMRITEQMAARYGKDERVIAWQTDNEFGCHDTIRCTCPSCEPAFQHWLEARYGSLEALNEAWGTNFWSQRYSAWSQIQPPRPAPADHNPGLLLDFYRFSSESWVKFNAEQVALLRQHAPGHLITHNLMIYFFHFDHYQVAQDLDFVSWDNYHHFGAQPVTVAANHDLIWGAKEKNFWVIEQQVGQVNWSVYNPQFPPGMLALKAMQAIAHGADGILYFRWRQARKGAEMYHSGLLDHAARPTRALAEAALLGERWETLAQALEGIEPAHDAAILHDFASHWALERQPHTRSLNFQAESDEPLLFAGDEPLQSIAPMNRAGLYLLPMYEALWRNNLQAAIISPEGRLERYRVLFAPQLHIATASHAARLRAWVEAGGSLVVGPRAGYKDESNGLHEVPQPGPLAELLGGTVREFDTREPGNTVELDFGDEALQAGVWCEVWEPAPGTQVLATYGRNRDGSLPYYAGQAAVLYRRLGKGQVITLGTMGGWQLIEYLLPQLGLSAPIVTPMNVEAVRRGPLLFLLNHTEQQQEVTVPRAWGDLFDKKKVEEKVRLAPYGW